MKPNFGEQIYFADGLRGFPPSLKTNFNMLKFFFGWQKGTNQCLFVVRFFDRQFLAEYDCQNGETFPVRPKPMIRDSKKTCGC